MTAMTYHEVLLLESDADERRKLTMALRQAGLQVLGAGSIAEVERWPKGDVVIMEAERYTAWWKTVGVRHVVVLARTAEEGAAACARGATVWVQREARPDLLVSILRGFNPDAGEPRAADGRGRV